MRRAALVALLATACVEFPDEYRIEDLRILEIRSEPPEITFFDGAPIDGSIEDVLATPPATTDITLSVLAAHPDVDAAFDYTWFRCKAESRNGEPTTGFLRVPCGGEQKEELDPGAPSLPTVSFSPVQTIIDDIAAIATGTTADPVAVIGSLAEDPRDLFSGLRLNVHANVRVGEADLPVDTLALDGRKRVVLFDPAIVAVVLRAARDGELGAIPMIQGVETPSLCTNVSQSQLSTLLGYLEERVPNRSPEYVELELLREGSTSTVAYDPRQGPIELSPGESILMAGRVTEESLETYRVIDDNCELVELDETMAWSWFITHGELTDQLTALEKDDPEEADVSTRYTAPTDFPGDELRTRVYSVLRDGRGGSDSVVIDILVRR